MWPPFGEMMRYRGQPDRPGHELARTGHRPLHQVQDALHHDADDVRRRHPAILLAQVRQVDFGQLEVHRPALRQSHGEVHGAAGDVQFFDDDGPRRSLLFLRLLFFLFFLALRQVVEQRADVVLRQPLLAGHLHALDGNLVDDNRPVARQRSRVDADAHLVEVEQAVGVEAFGIPDVDAVQGRVALQQVHRRVVQPRVHAQNLGHDRVEGSLDHLVQVEDQRPDEDDHHQQNPEQYLQCLFHVMLLWVQNPSAARSTIFCSHAVPAALASGLRAWMRSM